METIEATELAKRRMMASKLSKPTSGSTWKLSIPGNFNANFHQHR